ncbi:vascular endothelial growth factor receptor 1-like [Paramacrobiotus metropolitanus]|uniref:vascular endothelial growth factor receptor 1-like n=1 Tax=Paramacrobiotus metropolitanus TaxID=2943436 RepID=UPI0024458615|nr:vascular endothelial growth factor receptor 1-like [Paramacrobiotus metropolitanus]
MAMEINIIRIYCLLLYLGMGIQSILGANVTEIFRDDFNGTALDTTKWYIQKDYPEFTEHYDPGNVRLEKGILKLRAGNRRNGNVTVLTGARIFTGDKFSFSQGEVVMRVKFPVASNQQAGAGLALLPCMSTAIRDCSKNESLPIPTVYVQSTTPNVLDGILTYVDEAGRTLERTYYFYNDEDLSLDYHTIRLVWTRDLFAWFVDEELALNQTVPGLSRWPRMYLQITMISTAIYSQPNYPFDAADVPHQEFCIDYIYVHQFTNAIWKDYTIPAVLATVIPVTLLTVLVTLIGIKMRSRRQRHGNMQKLYGANRFVSTMYSLKNLLARDNATFRVCSEIQQRVQQLEVPLSNIRLTEEVLNSNNTSVTLKGYATGIHGEEGLTTIAVKRLQLATEASQIRLLRQELEILVKAGQHVNIITLLGVVLKGDFFLLLEFAEYGALPDYLQAHRGAWFYNQVDATGNLLPFDEDQANQLQQTLNEPPSKFDRENFDWQILSTRSLLRFAHHVSRGLEYLHARSIIHRNLSVTNILICSGQVAKIFGFEMAQQATEYIETDSVEVFSPRYLAPESLSASRFSTKSDIWSLGVVLWEMFSFAESPSAVDADTNACDDVEFTRFLASGRRMPRPEKCPSVIFDLLPNCWRTVPDERPNALSVMKALQNANEDLMEHTYLHLDYWHSQGDNLQSVAAKENHIEANSIKG